MKHQIIQNLPQWLWVYVQKMAMFAQTQEPPFDDDLPTSVHTAGVDRGEVENSLQKHKM